MRRCSPRRPSPSSATVREEVLAARERQAARLAGTGAGCNADMPQALAPRASELPLGAREALRDAYADGTLSARGHGRVLRVARTDRRPARGATASRTGTCSRRSRCADRRTSSARRTVVLPLDVCGPCLRRTHLLGLVAPRIERAGRGRAAFGGLLALGDEDLRRGARRPQRPRASTSHARRSSRTARATRSVAAGLGAVCRHGAWYPRALLDLRGRAGGPARRR